MDTNRWGCCWESGRIWKRNPTPMQLGHNSLKLSPFIVKSPFFDLSSPCSLAKYKLGSLARALLSSSIKVEWSYLLVGFGGGWVTSWCKVQSKALMIFEWLKYLLLWFAFRGSLVFCPVSELLAHSCRCCFLCHVLGKCWGDLFHYPWACLHSLPVWKAVWGSIWSLLC